MHQIPKWTHFETTLTGARAYPNPFWDVDVQVHLTAPSGRVQTVDGFWDGGDCWRARFSPDEVGTWCWVSACSNRDDTGLHDRQGSFQCMPYTGDNPLYQSGPLRLSENHRYLEHADGIPFFWLGDTAWNGVLRAKTADWNRYLQTRRQQAFTVIQFVSTQWRGCSQDPSGESGFEGTERIRLFPAFFQRLDPKVAAINENGLVAAPVLLWALQPTDPGQSLSEMAAARLVRYLVARWGAYAVVWMLGGDGHYRGERAERWKRIANAALSGGQQRLATMHPCGQQWVGEEFRGEAWFDLIGYQSGHGDAADHLRWLVQGPPSTDWANEPPLPVINLEPNYETHPSYHSQAYFTAREVRCAAYWSLLITPTAGVTFGHNAIWVWAEEPTVPEGHDTIGPVSPWYEGLDTPGVQSMTRLRHCFDALPWWQLRPLPELIAQQPGTHDPQRFVVAAATEDRTQAVVYLPEVSRVQVRTELLRLPTQARWFNPRTGAWQDVGKVIQAARTFAAPDRQDWVLCFRDPDLIQHNMPNEFRLIKAPEQGEEHAKD